MNVFLNNINFSKLPQVWQRLSSDDQKIFEEVLVREVGEKHPLYGKECKALARRIDRDEFLFFINQNEGSLVVVELSFSLPPHHSEFSPAYTFYKSFEDFIRNESE